MESGNAADWESRATSLLDAATENGWRLRPPDPSLVMRFVRDGGRPIFFRWDLAVSTETRKLSLRFAGAKDSSGQTVDDQELQKLGFPGSATSRP
jgi:hypothetical protein